MFGPLEVIDGDAAVAVAGPGERALLARLACSAGRVVSSQRLVDDLWGEDLPANPTGALQVRVSKLRRQVGGAVRTTAPGYLLDVPADGVDTLRFDRLLAAGRRPEALALYRGQPLAEFQALAWARLEATRLEERHLAAVEDELDHRLAAGGDPGLVSELEALVGTHPLRERLRGQLMIALYRSDRSADALECYQDGRRRLRDDLGLDPSPSLQRLERAILRRDPSLERPRYHREGTATLPTRLSSFVGRDGALRQVADSLDRHRLVTLVGPGGVGKTSLAVEAAATHPVTDGTYFVALAGLSDPAAVAPAVACVLGIADPGPGPAGQTLGRALAHRQVLVVIDNCEHLVEACARLVEELLTTSAGTRILATSREPLDVAGEAQLPVPPLDTDDAVALFADRARLVDPAFSLESDGDGVRAVCERLDGIPLAIELAAGWVRSMPVADLAERLEGDLRLLSGGRRTAEARHRTLRATIDWSHDRLDRRQQSLLRRLSVFRGGWTVGAAEAVAAGAEVAAGEVLELLAGLVDRSLVVAHHGRFRLLETIRHYATERLDRAGEGEEVRERHARYFLALAEEADAAVRGPQQARWLARLRAEDDNLGAALAWCREGPPRRRALGLRLAGALGWYWYLGRQIDGRRELAATLSQDTAATDGQRARALLALSLALRPAGCIVHPSPDAAEAARQSLALVDGDTPAAALGRLLVAVEAVAGIDVAAHLDEVDHARHLLHQAGDRWGTALADFVEMEIHLHHGAEARALPLGQAAVAAFTQLGDDWGRSAVPLHLGAGLRRAGRPADAAEVLHQALAACREAGLANNAARTYAELGGAAADAGHVAEGERWFAECQRLAADLGDDTLACLALLGQGTLARLAGDPAVAVEHFATAHARAIAAGVGTAVDAAVVGLAGAHLDAGRLDDADAVLAGRRDADTRPPSEGGLAAGMLEQQARLAWRRGQGRRALGLLDQASAIRHQAGRPRSTLEARDAEEVARPPGTSPQ
ncbi:MAG TPA: BTAD domain-containing putative transcriptional regulator [Acidimicrobiales bacterium]|nr:BTAD domain-containing putative transcriptional regulator [Acidimicrobiales bacterium]